MLKKKLLSDEDLNTIKRQKLVDTSHATLFAANNHLLLLIIAKDISTC